MPSFNKVILMGNLTRDPDIKYTPKGTAVADIGLAINRNYTTEKGEKREEVTFVNVTLWGRVAEIVGEYCKKGKPLLVEGHLQLDQWDDKETGKKRTALKIIGENIQLLGSKDGGGRQDGQEQDEGHQYDQRQRQSSGRAPASKPQASRQPPPRDPDLDVPEEEIPF